eukprot:gene17670-23259_t
MNERNEREIRSNRRKQGNLNQSENANGLVIFANTLENTILSAVEQNILVNNTITNKSTEPIYKSNLIENPLDKITHINILQNRASAHLEAIVHNFVLESSIKSNKDLWENKIIYLVREVVSAVDPNVREGDSMDIRNYVKLKIIPGGSMDENVFIDGVVFRKNVSHKKMMQERTKSDPRVLLLSGGIDFQRMDTKLSSMDTLIEQEDKYMEILVDKIMSLKPDIVLVGKSVARRAQELFCKYSVIVMQNMKQDLLDRISRMTGAKIISSTDHMFQQFGQECLGTCGDFTLRIIQDDPEKMDQQKTQRILKTRIAKGSTYAYIQGCPSERGCTLVLRGADRSTLNEIKHIISFSVLVAYHLRLEVAYYTDRCAMLPSSSDQIDYNLESDDDLVDLSDCTIENIKQLGDRKNRYILSTSLDIDYKLPYWGEIRGLNGYKGKKPLVTRLSPKDHQTILVTSLLMHENAQRSRAEVKGIRYYTNQDLSLGQFLIENCFSIIRTGSRESSMLDQTLSFIHRPGRLDVSVIRINDNINTNTTFEDSLSTKYSFHLPIYMSSFCKECNQIVTPDVLMSDETWKMSFGKFMEIFFYNTSSRCRTGGCNHILQSLKDSNNQPNTFLHSSSPSINSSLIFGHSSVYVDDPIPIPVDAVIDLPIVVDGKIDIQTNVADILSVENEVPLAQNMDDSKDLREFTKLSRETSSASSIFSSKESSSSSNTLSRDISSSSTVSNSNIPVATSISNSDREIELQNNDSGKFTSAVDINPISTKTVTTVPSNLPTTQVSKPNRLTKALARFVMGKDTFDYDENDNKYEVNLGELGEGRLGMPTGRLGEVIPVHDDEPGSIIAYSLASVEYYEMFQEFMREDYEDHIDNSADNIVENQLDRSVSQLNNRIDNIETTNDERLPINNVNKNEFNDPFDEDITTVSKAPLNKEKSSNLLTSEEANFTHFSPNESIFGGQIESNLQTIGNDPIDISNEVTNSGRNNDGQIDGSLENHTDRSVERHIDGTSDSDYPTYHQMNKHNIEIYPTINQSTKTDNYKLLLEKQLLSQRKSHIKHRFEDIDDKGNVLCKFQCQSYWATQFEALRFAYFNERDNEHYIRSLSMSNRWVTQGGKSGAAFSKSSDDRFVVKVINKVEMQMFLDFAPAYFEYMVKAFFHNLPTVLCKVLGVYTIGYHNKETGKKMLENVVVMENIFYQRNITSVFDLKGSSRARYLEIIGEKPTCFDEALIARRRMYRDFHTKPTSTTFKQVLLDDNLMELTHGRPFPLQHRAKLYFTKAVTNDTLFLRMVDVVDYSILVGFDENSHEIVVGIIDYMRKYDIVKKMERMGKSVGMLTGQAEPTIIQPPQYRNRFQTAMNRYFMTVPDKWVAHDF